MILATSAILAIGWERLPGDPFETEIRRYHIALLHRAAKVRSDLPLVVAIGGSNVNRSILDPHDFPQPAGVPSFRLVRLVAPGGVPPLDDTFITALAALRPSVLVVHEEAPFYNRFDAETLNTWIRDRIGVALRLSKKQPQDPIARLREHYGLRPQPFRKISDKRIAIVRARRHSRFAGGEVRQDVLRAIDAARSVGSRIILLRIPYDPRWMQVFADDIVALRNGIDGLVQAGGVEHLTCPQRFSGTDFVDLNHMAESAGLRHTAWLATALFAKDDP